MKVSIVIPIFNEEGNIKQLYSEIVNVFKTYKSDYEIIAVNDGSIDNSLNILRNLCKVDQKLKVLNFKFNTGQTAAMSAGIKVAQGDVIIPMDSDLQNDPKDIPKFIEKLDEGYDVVSGWRKNRKDFVFTRKIPSLIANWIIRIMTVTSIHDYGCSMKAYKKDLIQGISLYGEMHRFIPAYAKWHGAKVTEIIVNHRARIHGKTKYGLSRTFKVILDLVVVKFLSRYMNKPMHFFGGIGFVSFGLGLTIGIITVVLKLAHLRDFVSTPLPILSVFLMLVGVQFIGMGVLAEMLMRVYYESKDSTPYVITERINI